MKFFISTYMSKHVIKRNQDFSFSFWIVIYNYIVNVWVMSRYLHYSEIKWLNKKEIGKFDVDFTSENSLDGYIYIRSIFNILMN